MSPSCHSPLAMHLEQTWHVVVAMGATRATAWSQRLQELLERGLVPGAAPAELVHLRSHG